MAAHSVTELFTKCTGTSHEMSAIKLKNNKLTINIKEIIQYKTKKRKLPNLIYYDKSNYVDIQKLMLLFVWSLGTFGAKFKNIRCELSEHWVRFTSFF